MAFKGEWAVSQHTETALLSLVRNVAWIIGVPMHRDDFVWADGEWTIDGMNPYEWAEAMMQD